MTIRKIFAITGAALLTGGLLATASVQAQPGPHRDDRRAPIVRQDHRPPVARPNYRPAARPMEPMRVGRPLPSAYRGYNYRVDNWQHYHLRRPGYGQYWVQYGAQFMLVNPAGVVLQIFVP